MCLLQLPLSVLGSSSRFPWCGLVRALNHRASTQIICSFLTFKGFLCSLLWGVLTCIWKCGFFCAEGSPKSLVAHAPHFTQCISSNIHQTSTVNTWCWRTGFRPEKINTPNQTHSTLKTLINPHHRLKLYRNAKSHCPILCLEKLGQATFLRLPRAREQKLTRRVRAGPAAGRAVGQGQLPRWMLSGKHHVVTCPEPHLHISFYSPPPPRLQ